MTTEKKLHTAMHVMAVETEARVLLEKAINDLNTLKHRTFSKELREDLNTAMDLLEKHREALSYRNVAESILNDVKTKEEFAENHINNVRPFGSLEEDDKIFEAYIKGWEEAMRWRDSKVELNK